jgi:hypothetical protein
MAECESTISFVIAKSLISKIFITVLNSWVLSLLRSEPCTVWRIIAYDIDLHPRTLMNSPFKPLKNNQSKFELRGRMTFRTSLARKLIYELDFRQMSNACTNYYFVFCHWNIKDRTFNTFPEIYCCCALWSFWGSLHYVYWTGNYPPVVKYEYSVTFSKYNGSALRHVLLPKFYAHFFPFSYYVSFFSVILLDLVILYDIYLIK